MGQRFLLIGLLAALGCTDDPGDRTSDSSEAGSGGASGTGGASTGGATTNGGTSGTTSRGGNAGSANTGGNGGSAVTGGTGGASGSAGASAGTAGSSAGSSSTNACGEVTRNGRCVDNVYEWCDYFTGAVERLDCTPLGATCRALERQNNEAELNGCVLGPCTTAEASCDGALAMECENGDVVVTDCAKHGGPDSRCVADGTEAGCTRTTCSTPSEFSCAGDLRLICNEDGELVIDDCSRCDPEGTCVQDGTGTGESSVRCDRFSFGCED